MERESISDGNEQGPPPPVFSTLRRRKRRPMSRRRELERKDSPQQRSSLDSTLPRPKRKSLKGIKGTSLSRDEAEDYAKRWRKSLSGPVEEEMRRGSRQSLPMDAMKLVSSFALRKVQVAEQNKDEAYKVGFNVFSKSDDELVEHIDKMMDCFTLITVFKDRQTLHNLINGIRKNYNSNPFHNFKHAFGVTQMAVVFILRDISIAKALGKIKILAFLIAGLGHDLNHPGNDNSYEIALDSQLVRDYTREAVLENFHAYNLLALLKEPDKNVFHHLRQVKQREIRQCIVEAVLGTDMKQHHTHVEFLSRTTDFHTAIRSRIYRRGITNAIMHACDLSGQCVDLEVAVDWEGRITEEFRNQASLLKAKGKTVPRNLQDLEDARKRAELQLGFIDHVLEPLWAQIARCIPAMEGLYDNLTQVVRVYYQTLHDNGEEVANEYLAQYRHSKVFSSSGKFILNVPTRRGLESDGEADDEYEAYTTDGDDDCETVHI